MFTLGNKEAIVNTTRQYAPITLSQKIILNDFMVIPGFGTFHSLQLTSFDARRASDAQLDKLKLTCPSAGDLGITTNGVPVVVHLRVNSLRQASETAIDFIKRGRPLILELKLDALDADTDVADKLYAALEELPWKFLNQQLPITWTNPGATADIEFTATEGFYQINESVTFLKRGDIFAYEATTTNVFPGALGTTGTVPAALNELVISSLTDLPGGVNVNDTLIFAATPTVERKITEIVVSTSTVIFEPAVAAPIPAPFVVTKAMAGVEAVNDGKYLEENVRMSTPFTSDTYAIKPGEVPIIDAKYTMLSWEADSATSGAYGWAGHKTGDIKAEEFKNNRYTLYLNEDVCNAAGEQTETILTWALTNGGVVTADDLKKANGAQAEPIPDLITNFLA